MSASLNAEGIGYVHLRELGTPKPGRIAARKGHIAEMTEIFEPWDLSVLDGMAYGAWKSMCWAKERGVLKTLDPFAAYINKDAAFATQIIQNAKFLQQ